MSLDQEHGEIFIGGESKTPEKTLELVETYISNVLMDKDFFKNKETDLVRIKKAMIGSFVNLFNNVNKIGTTTTGLLLLGENIFEYVEILKNITLADVEAKFRDFYQPHHSTKVIIK
jgi:predicted Zn-dependent peptidase